jgi:hypothetical protein
MSHYCWFYCLRAQLFPYNALFFVCWCLKLKKQGENIAKAIAVEVVEDKRDLRFLRGTESLQLFVEHTYGLGSLA